MNTPIYYVDAFTEKLFAGNPAAVIFSDLNNVDLMQAIAAENNLSETAFVRTEKDTFYIRWFSPTCEIDLCGHATLASAYVYFNFINTNANEFTVHSQKNGPLKVVKDNNQLVLDFPRDNIKEDYEYSEDVTNIFANTKPLKIFKGRDDLLVIFENELDIINLKPKYKLFSKIPMRGIIATSPSSKFDFVSRCFFPSTGVNEDPVTGSAHTTLTPYWAQRLGKLKLHAKQLSKRGGLLHCELVNDRVLISGKAVLYMKGHINLP